MPELEAKLERVYAQDHSPDKKKPNGKEKLFHSRDVTTRNMEQEELGWGKRESPHGKGGIVAKTKAHNCPPTSVEVFVPKKKRET